MNECITSLNQLTIGNPIYAQTSNGQQVVVYSGIIRSSGIKVAIKLYRSLDPDKYKSEIDLLRYVSGRSDYFLKFYGSFKEETSLYIIMEYCGQNLSNLIASCKSEQKITNQQIKSISLGLIEAFANLESNAIYHRDIKPENILLDENLVPKIIDFSISLIREEQENKAREYMYPAIGTATYMAPELAAILKNQQQTGSYNLGKADVFSLGLTLIRLITLDSTDTFSTYYNSSAIVQRIQRIDDSFFRGLLTDMLQINPTDRKTFAELLDKHFDIQIVKFPVGQVSSIAGVNLKDQLSQNEDNTWMYSGTLTSGEEVMIKLYMSTDEEQVKKAKYFVSTLMKLSNHSNTFLKFYGSFIESGFVWVIHEHCPFSLQKVIQMRIDSNFEFTERNCFYYIYTLIKGFIFCFHSNISHNHINSKNLYLTTQGYLKISNFNLPYEERKNEIEATISTRARGSVSGEYYLAPEILNYLINYQTISEKTQFKSSYKSDIFSIGLVCYEILTLRLSANLKLNSNQGLLASHINGVKYEWARHLLSRMLAWDLSARADCAELDQILDYYYPYFN